jgi:hypothetical protein
MMADTPELRKQFEAKLTGDPKPATPAATPSPSGRRTGSSYFFFFAGSGPTRSMVTPISFTGSAGLSPWTRA